MKLQKILIAAMLLIAVAVFTSSKMLEESSSGRYYTPTLQGTLNGADTVELGVLLLSKWKGAIALRAKHTTGTATIKMYLQESDWNSGYTGDIYWRTVDSIDIATGDFDADSLAVDRIAATSVEGVRHRFAFATVSDTIEYIIRPVYKLE